MLNRRKANKIINRFEKEYFNDKRSIHNYSEVLKYLATGDDLYANLRYAYVMKYYNMYDVAEKICKSIIGSNRIDYEFDKDILGKAHCLLGQIYLHKGVKINLAYYNFLMSSFYSYEYGKYYIALMYRDGIFVVQSYDRYKDIILNDCNIDDFYSDLIMLERIKIHKKEGNIKKCIACIKKTGLIKPVIMTGYDYYESGIGEMIKIKKIANEFNLLKEKDIDLYCLPIYLTEHLTVGIYCNGNQYKLEQLSHNGKYYYRFDNKNYRNYEELLTKGTVGNIPLFRLNEKINKFLINGRIIKRRI